MIRETVGLKTQEPGYSSVQIKPSIEIVDDFDFCYETISSLIRICKKGKKWMIRHPKEMKVSIDLNLVDGVLVDECLNV